MKNWTIRRIASVVIDKREDRYISFPDIVRTSSGKLVIAYREADIHYPPDTSQTFMILADSLDEGRTWTNFRRYPHQPREQSLWAWHCPRLTLISDGRIALVCDLAAPKLGIAQLYVSVSSDECATWSEPVDTGAAGIVPDRIVEISPSEWIYTAHYSSPRGTPTFYQFVVATTDSGETWTKRSVISDDPNCLLCEGSIAKSADGKLVCYLRENSFIHYPSFVSTSIDNGHSWTHPLPHPTHGHRPCAGYIDDTNILVTYRNVAGNPGLSAWIGEAEESGREAGGIDLDGRAVRMTNEGLFIQSDGGPSSAAEFLCPPVAGWNSPFYAAAEVRCETNSVFGAGLRAGGVLRLTSNSAAFDHLHRFPEGPKYIRFGERALDATKFHRYEIIYTPPRFEIRIDGHSVMTGVVSVEPSVSERRVTFGNLTETAAPHVRYHKHEGLSVWRSVEVRATEPSGEVTSWEWDYRSGKFPNQYQRDKTFQIDSEESGLWPESGYSGWVRLNKHQFYCVDYRRGDAQKPYVVGHILRVTSL